MSRGIPETGNTINSLWGWLLIEELLRNGVNHCCVSPGSRSAPLTVAAARHPGMTTVVCHDERGAAFYALGYARATGNPVVLICTSGTAAAHYFPALIEAAMDHLPMLILSADRPVELQETGANQSIRQHRLFGDYVKWFFALPCPDRTITGRMLLTTVDQALYQARLTPAGPVHLNCPFREPLAPMQGDIHRDYLDDLQGWLTANTPYTRYEPFARPPVPAVIEEIAGLLRTTSRGIVAVGRLTTEQQRQAVSHLLQSLQWPAVVDITSGLRLGHDHSTIIHYFDQLLLSATFRHYYRPDVILRIGGEIVSKRFLALIEALPSTSHHVVIQDHPLRDDPAHNVTRHLEADLSEACLALAGAVGQRSPEPWLQAMRIQSMAVDSILAATVEPDLPVSEISTARLLSEMIPESHGLWLANSMPIRDMDMYAHPSAKPVPVGANRGASGIDGTLATAVGYGAGLAKPMTLIMGDVALIHDMNSLMLVKNSSAPVIIIVINNNGGGIFSFLPIAQFDDVFEDYFATPHGLEFTPLAALFSLDYARVRTNKELVEAYRQAVESSQSVLIEVLVDRRDNVRHHQRLQNTIVERLESLVL